MTDPPSPGPVPRLARAGEGGEGRGPSTRGGTLQGGRASERLAWAARLVDPAPDDRLLEVGCGHGVLVALLAERLTTGQVVGLDRSPTMVAAATSRNRAAITAGRVRLHATTFAEAELPDGAFDVVLSFNVRAFWTPPAVEWDVVRRVLAPGGRVLMAFSVMAPGALDAVEDAVGRLVDSRGLGVTTVHRAETEPIPSAAIELRSHPAG